MANSVFSKSLKQAAVLSQSDIQIEGPGRAPKNAHAAVESASVVEVQLRKQTREWKTPEYQ